MVWSGFTLFTQAYQSEYILKLPTAVASKKGLDKQCRPRSDCFWRSNLIRVFPVYKSKKLFVNSSLDNPHFYSWKQKEMCWKLSSIYRNPWYISYSRHRPLHFVIKFHPLGNVFHLIYKISIPLVTEWIKLLELSVKDVKIPSQLIHHKPLIFSWININIQSTTLHMDSLGMPIFTRQGFLVHFQASCQQDIRICTKKICPPPFRREGGRDIIRKF